jgi:hypothetical protein
VGIALAAEQSTGTVPVAENAKGPVVPLAARVTRQFPAKPISKIDPNNFFDEAAYLPYNIEMFGEPGVEKPAKSDPKRYKTEISA